MAKNDCSNPINTSFTLGTIWEAFVTVQGKLLGATQTKNKRIFSFPADDMDYCLAKKNSKPNFFDVWVDESLKNYLGETDSLSSNIMAGNGRADTQKLQKQLEKRALQMFWDYKNHLEKVLERHVKVLTCYKNNTSRGSFDYDLVDVKACDVKKEITEKWYNEYASLLDEFKNGMIEEILNSGDFKNDTRIRDSKFFYIVVDNNRDAMERLTILSIICLFAGKVIKEGRKIKIDEDTNENEKYFFNSLLYNQLYDSNRKLKRLSEDGNIQKQTTDTTIEEIQKNGHSNFQDVYKYIINVMQRLIRAFNNFDEKRIGTYILDLQDSIKYVNNLSEAYTFFLKDDSLAAKEIVEQFNKFGAPYNSFANSDRVSEEAKRYRDFAMEEYKKLYDLVVKNLDK